MGSLYLNKSKNSQFKCPQITSFFVTVFSRGTASVAYNTSGVNFAGVATPRKNKAIVVIPGVLGSQLQNSSGQMVWNFIDRSMQLECNTNGTSKNTITPYTKDGYGAGDIYKKLYERLQNKYQNT